MKKFKFINQYKSFHKINYIEEIAKGYDNYYSLSQKQIIDNVKIGFISNALSFKSSEKELTGYILNLDNSEFAKKLEMYDIQKKNISEILALSSLAIGLRAFRKAYLLRYLALRIIDYIEQSKYKYLYIDQIIAKKIELQEYLHLKKYLKFSKILRTNVGKSKYSGILLEVLSKKFNPAEQHKDFFNFVKGKDVAVVGPLKLSDNDISEINSYDLRVKLKCLDFFKIGNNPKPEICAEVIYYTKKSVYDKSNATRQLLSFNNNSKTHYDPEFLVGKNINIFKTKYAKANLRMMHDTNPLTLNGGLNFIPRVILDLLLFKPRTIKVFGTDLYTSINYENNYVDGVNRGVSGWQQVYHDFVNHDLITNFKAMRILFNKFNVKGSLNLEKIISGGIFNYLDLFERK